VRIKISLLGFFERALHILDYKQQLMFNAPCLQSTNLQKMRASKLSDRRKCIDMKWLNAKEYEYDTMMRRRGMIGINLVKP
jgi:hypothetical protein